MSGQKYLHIMRIGLLALCLFTSTSTALAKETADMAGEIQLSLSNLPGFREVYVGMTSDVQFYEVAATGISGNLQITAEDQFEISLQCHTGYTSHIALASANGQVAETRIFVRFAPKNTGQLQAAISHKAQMADDKTLEVTGSGTLSQIPEAYYSQATGRGSQLKTELFQIIRDHQAVSYASIWAHFETTDVTFGGQVWDMYSDTPCQDPPYVFTFVEDQDRGSGGGSEGQFFNREHTMPLSWFGGQQTIMASDLFHIYPTDKWVNALRANYPYGEVSKPNTTTLNGSKLGTNALPGYSGLAFEPVNAYKGDLARAYLYMVTRYEDLLPQWNYSPEANQMLTQETYPGFSKWALSMLLRWHDEDPVSQKEIMRNNAVYAIQGNRNPFIDHPEFAEFIWGDTTTHTMHMPHTEPILIYPNPANHYVHIDSENMIQLIEVVAISGNLVTSIKMHSNYALISTANIPNGLYLVRMHFSNYLITQPLTILKDH